jgi:hypothetical protein
MVALHLAVVLEVLELLLFVMLMFFQLLHLQQAHPQSQLLVAIVFTHGLVLVQ